MTLVFVLVEGQVASTARSKAPFADGTEWWIVDAVPMETQRALVNGAVLKGRMRLTIGAVVWSSVSARRKYGGEPASGTDLSSSASAQDAS